MTQGLPYCGTAPAPGELLGRFNWDPVLIAVLLAIAAVQLFTVHRRGGSFGAAACGWLIAAGALISPLCALSVSLFSARVGQHMCLVLLAAPLIALGMPRKNASGRGWTLWASAAVFFMSLWFWHMPAPYAATFESYSVYWSMHITLFGSAVWLWNGLLNHSNDRTASVLAVGVLTSVQMGLLGSILSLADHPMYVRHLTTTARWGLSALQDQQLGGIVMWVPGIILFLWTAIRSLSRLWTTLEQPGSV